MAKSLAIASLQILSVLFLASLAQSKSGYKHIRLYDHEFKGNTSMHEQTIYPVAWLNNTKPGFNTFGTLFIGENILKIGKSWTSATVGLLHGIVGVASLPGTSVEALATVHFLNGTYQGSTIEIKGIIGQENEVTPLSEVAIVGGTQKFRGASGYLTFTGTDVVNATGHNVYQLDLYYKQCCPELETEYDTIALFQ